MRGDAFVPAQDDLELEISSLCMLKQEFPCAAAFDRGFAYKGLFRAIATQIEGGFLSPRRNGQVSFVVGGATPHTYLSPWWNARIEHQSMPYTVWRASIKSMSRF